MPEQRRDSGLRVMLLGPVRAFLGTAEIDLGSARTRTLFAILALHAGQVVPTEEIIDGLWANSPPGNPHGSIYTYVNRLRHALDPQRDARSPTSLLESVPPGYRLNGEGVHVDADRFARHLSVGRALKTSDPATAVTEFNAAFGLWHADPLTGTSGPVVATARLRLQEQRFSLIEDHAVAMLTLGRHDEVIDDLRDLVRRYPLREYPRGLLMQAFHRAGRTEEAVAVFADVETVLSTELGIDPASALMQLRDRILLRDARLLTGPPLRTEIGPSPRQVTLEIPAQLPRQAAVFIGREAELTRLRTLLATARQDAPMIGVLSGAAGTGKTALALKVAHELAERFPDGQLFVNLRGFDAHEPAANPIQVIVSLLGVLTGQTMLPGQSEAELSAHFRSVLAGKRVLLVLDNALSSEQIRPLLPGSSSLVLVTSRNRLDGLVARDGAQVFDLPPLRTMESTSLLAHLLGMKQTPDAAVALGRIAELCGHLPLALGIVARRIAAEPEMRLSDVVTELSDEGHRLSALTSENDAIRPAFSWSYHALKPEPAQLFRRLGLYPGDVISTGAAAALNGTTVAKTRKLMDTLANSHLISWAGRDRYRIHDLLHLYTKELVHQDHTDEERAADTRRLLDWYLHSASNACQLLESGRAVVRMSPEPPPRDCSPLEFVTRESAAGWVIAESSALRSVIRHALALGCDDHAWKIVSVVWDDHRYGPLVDEWTDLMNLAVAAAERVGNTYAQMWLTCELALLYLARGLLDESMDLHTRCLEYWRTDGADQPNARVHYVVALINTAHILHFWGQSQQALQRCQDALPLARAGGYGAAQANVLGVIGTIYRTLGKLDEAEVHLRESLSILRKEPLHFLLLNSFVLRDLAWVERSQGRTEEAKIHLIQALKTMEGIGNALGEIRMLHPLRQVYHDLGQIAEAEATEQRIGQLADKYSISDDLVQAVATDWVP